MGGCASFVASTYCVVKQMLCNLCLSDALHNGTAHDALVVDVQKHLCEQRLSTTRVFSCNLNFIHHLGRVAEQPARGHRQLCLYGRTHVPGLALLSRAVLWEHHHHALVSTVSPGHTLTSPSLWLGSLPIGF